MGFLEKLFGTENKLPEQEAPKAVQSAAVPEKPVPFGYKVEWLCVKSESPQQVISALGLTEPLESGWSKGLIAAHSGKVFVSPALDGYVLAVGYGSGYGSLFEQRERLDEVGKLFPEVQYFASYRTVDYYGWAKYENGFPVRIYCLCGDQGELMFSEGADTPEEESLGFDQFIQSNEDDWEQVEFPDEDSVIKIASAWGIDPLFSAKEYPESTGYICEQ